MRAVFFPVVFLVSVLSVSALEHAAVMSGSIDWEKMEISFDVALDLAQSGYRLPSGRTASETELGRLYPVLVRPVLEALPVNSSATIGAYREEGSVSAYFTDSIAAKAKSVPPFLSTDFRSIRAVYRLDLSSITAELPVPLGRPFASPPLNLADTGAYSGIIIIANGELPIHGKRSAALGLPCLAPKLWDSDMNLLFDGRQAGSGFAPFLYMNAAHIFSSRPGGLSPEAEAVVGTNPLRIIATEVFGERTTDLIIPTEDVLKILSNEENRRLLRTGKIIIVLNDAVLKAVF
jgi:hypothetical protein